MLGTTGLGQRAGDHAFELGGDLEPRPYRAARLHPERDSVRGALRDARIRSQSGSGVP
jgi:hypothetical protein